MAKKSQPKNKTLKKPVEHKETTEEKVEQPIVKAYDMFARKKEYGFVAMTKEASMMADETSPKGKPPLPERIASCIHKIKEDK